MILAPRFNPLQYTYTVILRRATILLSCLLTLLTTPLAFSSNNNLPGNVQENAAVEAGATAPKSYQSDSLGSRPESEPNRKPTYPKAPNAQQEEDIDLSEPPSNTSRVINKDDFQQYAKQLQQFRSELKNNPALQRRLKNLRSSPAFQRLQNAQRVQSMHSLKNGKSSPSSGNPSLYPPSSSTPTLKNDFTEDNNIQDSSKDNQQDSSQDSTDDKKDDITIEFPHASILEILALYEQLTDKHIIREANLEGPELNISVEKPVPKKEAISLLESSMLLNGYTLVPLDEKSVKILGPSHPARAEGIPLYKEESQLPTDGEQLISFYKPLHFITPADAISVLQGVIQVNPYGSLVAVPNTSALVITDKTPVIQKALALLRLIDHEPSQIITEFITLKRADAQKTVDILNQITGKDSTNPNSSPSSNSPKPPGMPGMGDQGGLVDTGSGNSEQIVTGKVQFIPDKRTNRILLITRSDNYQYLRKMIDDLDQAIPFEEPLVRTLNYMSANDIFPVLKDMLKQKDDDSKDSSGNSQASSTPEPTPNSDPLSNSSGTGGAAGGSNGADKLGNAAQPQPPQSATIGSTSIISDPTANSITVYGPPESKNKASQIIDLLDKKPKQVYLAAVIGTLRLEKGIDYGSSYLFHYDGFNYFAGPEKGKFAGIPVKLGEDGIPVIPNPNDPINAADAISKGFGGLSLYGALSGSVDMYAQFLESTGKFRTIGRPVVYTSNNRKATIYSGQKVPYNSSTLSSIVAGSTADNTANSFTSNVTYQDVLLKLEVIPLVNSDGEINLTIAQQNQTVDPKGTAAAASQKVDAPVINTQELTTSVRVANGSTIVLGGLIDEQQSEEKNGIPFLSQIPLIGGLFGGYQSRSKVRNELVIMIQPIIVDSNAAAQRGSDIEGGKSPLGQTLTDAADRLKPTPTPIPTPKPRGFHPFGLGIKRPPKQDWSFNSTQF